jgi:hypothetical protein
MAMRLLTLLLIVASGLAFWGLVSIHHWLAYSSAGCLLGCAVALGWARGNAYQSVEYWNCNYPHWLLIIIGPPPIEDSFGLGIPKQYYYSSLPTVLPLVGGTTMTITLTFLAIFGSSLYIGFAVMFTVAWITGIVIFKRYFGRHKYTKIKDWSKFPPE